MLQSIALSSPLPTTNRFTPTATQRPGASPVAQAQRSGRSLNPITILNRFNPVLLWRELDVLLCCVRLSSLDNKVRQIKELYRKGHYGYLSLENVHDYRDTQTGIIRIRDRIRATIASIPKQYRSRFMKHVESCL
jgi:hypothetical protein